MTNTCTLTAPLQVSSFSISLALGPLGWPKRSKKNVFPLKLCDSLYGQKQHQLKDYYFLIIVLMHDIIKSQCRRVTTLTVPHPHTFFNMAVKNTGSPDYLSPSSYTIFLFKFEDIWFWYNHRRWEVGVSTGNRDTERDYWFGLIEDEFRRWTKYTLYPSI